MLKIKPFKNESDVILIGELNIENRVDRLSIFGSLDITRDKDGLANAKYLQSFINAAVSALESEDLPDQIAVAKDDSVKNPFQ
jgi:hypothetical protein